MKHLAAILLLTFIGFKNNISGQCMNAGHGADPSMGETFTTCGDGTTDMQIREFVSRFNNILHTNADFYFYDDSREPNAQANPKDKNIYIGISFLKSTINSQSGMTGVAFLIAHEMSHIFQFSNTDGNRYMEDRQVRCSELQADYLAAYMLGNFRIVDASNYNSMLNQCIEIGDVLFRDESHHGTKNERMGAAIWGYRNKDKSIEEVYAESYSHICFAQEDRLVYILHLNEITLFVLFGGKICTQSRTGDYNQVGQWSTNIGGDPKFPYSFEFSKSNSENLYMTLNKMIYNGNGQYVGYGEEINANSPNSKNREEKSNYDSDFEKQVQEYRKMKRRQADESGR